MKNPECIYAEEYGCNKLTCKNCNGCHHVYEGNGFALESICPYCEQKYTVPLLGKTVQLTTTRTVKELENLCQSERYECRMQHGLVTREYIDDIKQRHEVLLDDNLWVTIKNGMQVRNVYISKLA